ncbi:MAG: two-component regulator propeller domain-containing protein [Candidatus Eisenbacteria bacterium]
MPLIERRHLWPSLVTAVLLVLAPRTGAGFVLECDGTPEFQPISIEQGLSNDRINQVFQDSKGFLWISTTDGLNRYDGHEVQVYRHDPNDARSIAANWIAGVAEDAQGDIWVLFGIGGTDCFDRDREVFQHFRNDPADSTSLPRDDLTSAHLFPDGSFWFASGAGWVAVDRSGGVPGETRSASDFVRRHPFPPDHARGRPAITPSAERSPGSRRAARGSERHTGFHRDSAGQERSRHRYKGRPRSPDPQPVASGWRT